MNEQRALSSINPHLIGMVMKEAVRQAMVVIRGQRTSFTTFEKEGYGGKPDCYTSADKAAQEIYIRILRSYFPDYGIIAEEQELQIPCTHPSLDLWFTVDPLDGTKAYIKKRSHGIGSMVSLSLGDTVIAACIGDVMTGETFWFQPRSNVYRTCDDISEQMVVDGDRPLAEQYLLLDDNPLNLPSYIQACARPLSQGGLFKKIWIASGGIGLFMAQLWKGEVGGVVLSPGHDTPWDSNPVFGISRQMGFVFLYYDNVRDFFMSVPMPALKSVVSREHELFIIHRSRFEELSKWHRKSQGSW
ncbi:MAG: inositol monophosphatase family protein [Candidatus Sungbacteria bacterium]|nr:inositol monophosphatase family protein [bacterium]MDZ4285465.1 inositol monophosphatase family protein [Candidatus Sungbacteria bacterium]